MSLEYIRKTYGVPAKRGGRIRYLGKTGGQGTIVAARCSCIRVRMDGAKRISTMHPTWNVEYLDARKEES